MLKTAAELPPALVEPAYTIGEAHGITGVSPQTIRHWGRGDSPAPATRQDAAGPETGHHRADAGRPPGPPRRLSFLELIEVAVAGRLRAGNGGSFREIRRRRDGLAAEWETPFPLAHRRLAAHTEALPAPAVKLLAQMDYGSHGYVCQWSPLGHDQPIVLNPYQGYGFPAVRGRRLRVEQLQDYFLAGETIETLSQDFDLEPGAVEAALRYALRADGYRDAG